MRGARGLFGDKERKREPVKGSLLRGGIGVDYSSGKRGCVLSRDELRADIENIKVFEGVSGGTFFKKFPLSKWKNPFVMRIIAKSYKFTK